MKILIKEEEKNVILEMHSKIKNNKIVSEQASSTGIDAQLQAFIDDGRVANGKVVQLNSTNPQLKFAIKQESTKTPGKFRYLFIDKRIATLENGKFVFMKDAVWQPGQPSPKVDPNSGDIENLLKSGIWFKKEDLAKQGISEDELSSNWSQHPKYKNLYKRQGVGPSKSTGFTGDQQSFVDAWMKNPEVADNINRGIYKINPSAADFATGQWKVDNYFIADNSENYFPADSKGVKGLKVYFNNAKVTEKLSRENCRAKIKEFADKFKLRNSKPQTAQWISSNRAFVQQCADNFKFGGALSKIDDDLNLVGGMIEGGAGNSSPWHINLDKKLK
jgi:hypothetical protein